MKIRKNSITWYEPGRLVRASHKAAGKSLYFSALGAAFIGLLVAVVIIVSKQQSIFSGESLLLIVLFSTLAFFIAILPGLFGRSVAVTEKSLIRVPPGSRYPRKTDYGEIGRFGIETRSLDGEEFKVLQIFFASGKQDEIILQDVSDADAIATFLRGRGQAVEISD